MAGMDEGAVRVPGRHAAASRFDKQILAVDL
jgi:hypothetical protein